MLRDNGCLHNTICCNCPWKVFFDVENPEFKEPVGGGGSEIQNQGKLLCFALAATFLVKKKDTVNDWLITLRSISASDAL